MNRHFKTLLIVGLAARASQRLEAQTLDGGVTQVEPTWDSLAQHYRAPDRFVHGKMGVWMYSPPPEGKPDKDLSMDETLTKWPIEHYGPLEEFGYEDPIPLFKAEKWDPDGLVKFFKDCGRRRHLRKSSSEGFGRGSLENEERSSG